MRISCRLFSIVALASALLAAPTAASSPDQPATPPALLAQFDPFIAKIRTALALDESQVYKVQQVFAKHASKISQLRGRMQAQPYSPQLQVEIEDELRAMREEIAIHLTQAQKDKLSSVDFRPIPQPPAFILINIPPRPTDENVIPAERLIPVAATGRGAVTIRKLTEDQKIFHLVDRVTFGPRPGDMAWVKKIGIEKFLQKQLHPETIDDSDVEGRLSVLPTSKMTSAELYRFYPPPNVAEQRAKEKNASPVFGRPAQILVELQQQKLVRAVASKRQLLEIMTDFWFNHFNVFAQKGSDLWLLPSYERDVIRPHALGKFRDLLLAVAESPAMLYYLDNWLSTSPEARLPHPPPSPPPVAPPLAQAQPASPATPKPAIQNPKPPRPGINENYGRELMELHTVGVHGGYTQKDVQEVARAFTGWTIDRPEQAASFVYRPWMHDTGSKTVLGLTMPAGGGIDDGERVIDILARQPSTAQFISRKLCQRFVSDDPPPRLVKRAAQVFLKTDGDIRAVLKTIFTSPEFYSPSVFRSKVKSPLELVASSIRAIDGDTNGSPALHEWLRRMSEPLYQYLPPTGYGENSSPWMNTGVFLNRMNFIVALSNNQIPGVRYDSLHLVPLEMTASPPELTNRLTALIVHTQLSAESLRAVRAGLAEHPANSPAQRSDPQALVFNVAFSASPGGGPLLFVDRNLQQGQPAGPEPLPPTAESDAARQLITRTVELLLATEEFQRK